MRQKEVKKTNSNQAKMATFEAGHVKRPPQDGIDNESQI